MPPSPKSNSPKSNWRLRLGVAARWLAGGLLVVAGLLKLADLSGQIEWSHGLAALEVPLGIWIVFDRNRMRARAVGVLAFALLAGVALGMVVAGALSCGCFGAVTIPPWLALTVDVVVVGLLLAGKQVAAAPRT